MLDEDVVRLAMRGKLLSIASPAIDPDQAWENRNFEIPAPAKDVFWVRETLSMTSERQTMFESMTVQGVMTYTVFTASGLGTKLITQVTLAIANEFRPAQWVRPPECSFHLWRTERGLGRVDPKNAAWYFQPVNVFWRAHPTNAFNP